MERKKALKIKDIALQYYTETLIQRATSKNRLQTKKHLII